MNVLFWGTRGSLPYAVTARMIKEKLRSALTLSLDKKLKTEKDITRFIDNDLPFSISGGYGCNTSCIEIRGGSEYLLCDAGTGLRDFGNRVMKRVARKEAAFPAVFNILMSHLHWDHIQGFPFFTPAYIPGNTVNIYGFHDGMEDAFVQQQEEPFFPVSLSYLRGTINFIRLEPEKDYDIAGFSVRGIRQNHPGGSYGISFEKDGRKAVYATDSEHKVEGIEPAFLDFIRNADLFITDAQYNLADALHAKVDWGHSSNIIVTEMAAESGVGHLCIFHHDPLCTDTDLDQFLAQTRGYLNIFDSSSPLRIDLAYDGLEVDLGQDRQS